MELLIVIVVIAILAAITIVSYRGITTNAQVAALKSSLQQAATKLEVYKIDNGNYPPDQATVASFVNFDSSAVLTYAASSSTSAPAYCLIAAQGAQQFSVGSANKTPSDSACVVNLAVDPRATAYYVPGGPRVEASRFVSGGTYSLVTNATLPATLSGISTYAKYTVSAGRTEHGLHLSNNPQNASPGTIPWTVAAGTTYTLSASARYSGAVSNMVAHLKMRAATDSSTGTASPVSSATVALPPGQWVRLSQTYTVPLDATTIAAMFEGNAGGPSDTVGDTWDVTGIMATQGSTLYNYADGNSPGWSWTGAPNASTSFGPPL